MPTDERTNIRLFFLLINRQRLVLFPIPSSFSFSFLLFSLLLFLSSSFSLRLFSPQFGFRTMFNENSKKSIFLRMPFSSSGRAAKGKGLPKIMTSRLSSPSTSATSNPSRSSSGRPTEANKKNPQVSVLSPTTIPEQSVLEVAAVSAMDTPQPVSHMSFNSDSDTDPDSQPDQAILIDLSPPSEEVSLLDLARSIPLPSSPSLEPLVLLLPLISTEGLDRVIEIDPRLIPLPSSPVHNTFIDSVGLAPDDYTTVHPWLIPLPFSPVIEPEEDVVLSDLTINLAPLDSVSSSEELCLDSPLDQPDELSLASSTEDDPMPLTPQSPTVILSRPIVEFAPVKSPVDRSTMMTTETKKTLRKRISTHNFFNSHSNTYPNEPTSPTSPLYGSFPSFFGRSPFGRKPADPSTVSVPVSVISSSKPSPRSNSTVVGFQSAKSTSIPPIAARLNPTSVLTLTDPNRPKIYPSMQITPNIEKSKPIRSSSSEPHYRRQQLHTQAHPSQPQSNGTRKASTGPSALPLLPHPSAFASSHSCWNSSSPTSPIGSTGYSSSTNSAFGFDNRALAMNQKPRTRDRSVGRQGIEQISQGRRASRIHIPKGSSRADWINMLEEKERSKDRSASKGDLGGQEENEQYERAELCFMI